MSSGALLLTGSTPLELLDVPHSREMLLHVLGISPVVPHTPLVRHRTGLVATAVEGGRALGEVEIFIIARATPEKRQGKTLKVLEFKLPLPALLVAQKAGGSDFSKWTGYQEATNFVHVKDDLRDLLDNATKAEQALVDPDARFHLSYLESAVRELGKLAPKQPGVLRLAALDPLGNVAAAANFNALDWLGMRNFALRAFDARQTAHIEGALRAPAAHGSTAETPPVVEYIRWSEGAPKKDGAADVAVKVDGEVIAHGAKIRKPIPITKKDAPARVPVAGLPVFRADGTESKPVIWASTR